MTTTPQDWRVTADLEIDRCLAALSAARTADLSMGGVVQECWQAYEAAAAAAGAVIEAELLDGAELPTIAHLIGFSDIEAARRTLDTVRAVADRRLHERLPGA